jgi:hypothetical protein
MIVEIESDAVTIEPASRVDEEVGELADNVAQRHQNEEVGVGKIPSGPHF